MVRQSYRNSRGFTLIELLVAIGLMVFLMTLIVQIFITTTRVFNRAKAKTEIYQNARFALDRMGKEINNCLSTQLGTQDCRIGWPVGAGSLKTPWYGTTATVFATEPAIPPSASTTLVSRPFLAMVTSTSWIDTTGARQIGTAKVAFRIKKNSIPEALETVSCTLERALYLAEPITAGDPWASPHGDVAKRIKDSAGKTIPSEDYCQFVFFDDKVPPGVAHMVVQYFDTATKKYEHPAADSLTTFTILPQSVRVIIDVIDEKDREIRTISRQFTIYASDVN